MDRDKNGKGILGGVMLAYLIVLLHLPLIAMLGILVIFLQGVVSYMPLILAVGLTAVCASAYFLYRRLKSHGKSLRDTLNSPLFKGKSVEIDLLGGMASIRINSDGTTRTQPAIEADERKPLLEDRKSGHVRELVDLARSIENDHINQKAKDKSGRNLFN